MLLSHLGETRLAELMINQREQCRHDRTPLLISAESLIGDCFRAASPPAKMASSAQKIVSFRTRQRNQF
jgi:hypothetical protein